MTFYFASKYSNIDILNDIKLTFDTKTEHYITSRWLRGDHTGGSPGNQRRYAEDDLKDIDCADAVVIFELPIGDAQPSTGRAVELGYAYAHKKRVILVGDKRSVFHFLPGIEQFATVEAFLEMYT